MIVRRDFASVLQMRSGIWRALLLSMECLDDLDLRAGVRLVRLLLHNTYVQSALLISFSLWAVESYMTHHVVDAEEDDE